MKNEFIPYDRALKLKQLGFNEPCFASYVKETKELTQRRFADWYKDQQILAPLFQQAFRWFRDEYNLDKTINNWTEQPMDDVIWDKAYQYYINGEAYHPYFKSYEEAELDALDKLIEIVESKQNK